MNKAKSYLINPEFKGGYKPSGIRLNVEEIAYLSDADRKKALSQEDPHESSNQS